MPPEPTTPSGRSRPGADHRRRALGLDAATEPPSGTIDPPVAPTAAEPPSAPVRESLAASLARIPDLDPAQPVASVIDDAPAPAVAKPSPPMGKSEAPVQKPPMVDAAADAAVPTAAAPRGLRAPAPVEPAPKRARNRKEKAAVAAVATAAAPTVEPKPAKEPKLAKPEKEPQASRQRVGRGRTTIAPPPKPPWWRRVAFGVAVVVFIAAIPALVVFGSRLITDSTAGSFNPESVNPTDPGFEAQVEPTPTALAISYDDNQVPTGLTFLSLAGGKGGGSVVFVPLDTEIEKPMFGLLTLRVAWESTRGDGPEVGRQRLTSQVGRRLNVGIGETIALNNASWEQLVDPVSPLRIENPDTVQLASGTTIPSGPTELPAALVGEYLETRLPNESDLARLVRHEVVWEAWLAQIAEADRPDAVPGESTAGIGRFARALAAGPVQVETLPGEQVEPNLYSVDATAMRTLMTDAVASPTPAYPGSRFTVRLLNGVSADAIPSDVVKNLVQLGGAVTTLGNGPSFDTDKTTVVYGNEELEAAALLVADMLGATGEVRLDREAPDTVDITIVLGRDILGDAASGGQPGATTPNPAGEN